MRFAARPGLNRDRLVMVTVLALSAVFLFVNSRAVPILLWDESRNIVNALEMKQAGFGLVTTYDGQADLWNTKPPLLIWLMTGSVMLFGSSEWALRLPGVLATLGTLLLVMQFVRRTTGSIATAAMAAIFLTLSPALFAEHGALAADYDSLLLFFVTAYLSMLFFALHRFRPNLPKLLLAAAAVACAVLTKSVAGLVPGVGVVLYIVLTGRVARLWRSPRYVIATVAGALPVLLFLILRETQAPGYLAASWHNDAAGRFTDLLVAAPQPPQFYLRQLFAGYFSVTPLLLAAPLVLAQVRGRTRLVLIYSLCIACAQLAVISTATTKLNHYILPAMPFMSIAAAITLRSIAARFTRPRPDSLRGRLVFLTLIGIAALSLISGSEGAIIHRYYGPLESEFAAGQGSSYGQLFAALSRAHGTPITVVDPGFPNEDWQHYAPVLRAYQLIWAERGLSIQHVIRLGDARPVGGAIIASCAGPVVTEILARHSDISGVPGCAATRVE